MRVLGNQLIRNFSGYVGKKENKTDFILNFENTEIYNILETFLSCVFQYHERSIFINVINIMNIISPPLLPTSFTARSIFLS